MERLGTTRTTYNTQNCLHFKYRLNPTRLLLLSRDFSYGGRIPLGQLIILKEHIYYASTRASLTGWIYRVLPPHSIHTCPQQL